MRTAITSKRVGYVSCALPKAQNSVRHTTNSPHRPLVQQRQSSTTARKSHKISAPQCPEPPFTTALIYNQSKHSCASVLADLRAVWGSKIRVVQTLETGDQPLAGADGALFINPKTWGDLKHFESRLDAACTDDTFLMEQRKSGDIVFMPGITTLLFSYCTSECRPSKDMGIFCLFVSLLHIERFEYHRCAKY